MSSDSADIPKVLNLLRAAFAYMEPRIDPPSSLRLLDEARIRAFCATGEIWTLGTPPDACVFFSVRDTRLYMGKLAVSQAARGRGLARRLVDHAQHRARELGLHQLELETRIELTENHAAFARMGFVQTGEGVHEGFDRPTFIVMQKPVR